MNEEVQPIRPENVKIRPMDRGDLDDILEIDAEITGKERSTSWGANVADYLAGGITTGCRVAELDGKVVGFLLGDIKGFEYGLPRGGWIDVMGVSPQYHGMGIGTRLVESFIAHCRRLGVGKIYVLDRLGDEEIESFFTTVGFHESPYVVLEKEVE